MHVIGFGRKAREAYPATGGIGAAIASLARRWNEAANSVPISSAGFTTLAAVTLTPRVSGKFLVTVTGRADDTSGSPNGLQIYVGHGVDPLTPDYSITSFSSVPIDANGGASFSIIVDLAQAVSVTFPVGTPVRIGVAASTTSGTANVPGSGLQIEVQEIL